MPHFGLMDESAMPRDEAALLRARLHLRGGRRRMRQGKHAAAIAALYDALCSGMRWFILSTRRESGSYSEVERDLSTGRELFLGLVQAGVLDNVEGFEQWDTLLDQALGGQVLDFNEREVMTQLEQWLTQLGVMPFDEGALPAEDPSTY
jgi:hypothetical protein